MDPGCSGPSPSSLVSLPDYDHFAAIESFLVCLVVNWEEGGSWGVGEASLLLPLRPRPVSERPVPLPLRKARYH